MEGFDLLGADEWVGARVIKLDPVTITAKGPSTSAPGPWVDYGPTLEQAGRAPTAPVAAAASGTSGVIEWFKKPAWTNGYPRWQVGAIGAGVAVGVGTLLTAVLRR